ncbi:hypothetical protein GGP81_003243 [Salinibacter ruber]|uniref:hypothetical protein n=1 Tax=Salinibacter ruber TaxID=146919 RepID=UPI0021671956|nr:hypothetical protein [Salinibacter ruber]MCS3956695.1 hypothetical protein [Salinibacter ruber]
MSRDTDYSEIARNEISEHERLLKTELLEEMELGGGLDRVQNAVNSILKDLDYHNFSALYDHYFRGHPHSEVAERLDLSSGEAKAKIQEASEVLCDRLCRRLDVEQISREQTELIAKAAGARHRREYSRIMKDRVRGEDTSTGQHKESTEEREEVKENQNRKTIIEATVEAGEVRRGPEGNAALQGLIFLLSAVTNRSIRAYRELYKGRPGRTRSGEDTEERITIGDEEEIMQAARQLFEEKGPERIWFEGKGDLKGLRFSLRLDFGEEDEKGDLVFRDFEAPGQGLSLPENVAVRFFSDTGSETVFPDEGDGTVRVPMSKLSEHLEQGCQIRMSISDDGD